MSLFSFLLLNIFIYALTLRNDVSILPLSKRLTLGFLLTDELFAVSVPNEKKHPQYLFGAGLCFYLFWVVFSLVGILLATALPNLLNYHWIFPLLLFLLP